jgi:hypothetical protein
VTARVVLAGCGILEAEVRCLAERNHWPVDPRFFDSALHSDLERLRRAVDGVLRKRGAAPTAILYGSCHPQLDQMLAGTGTPRVEGQNCVEMLLGRERFESELAAGAYFLLEEWARRWEELTIATFGDHIGVVREIFRNDRKYLLAIRTPCSGDFAADAERAARLVDLPLRWLDVPLDHLETVLRAAIERAEGGRP